MPALNPPDVGGSAYAPQPPQPPQPPGYQATGAQTQGQGQQSQIPGFLSSLLQNQLGLIGAGTNQQLSGINMQAGGALGQEQTTDQQLLQQLNDTLASLGIQQTGLGQESAYGNQQYGFEQQQNALSKTGIEQSLQNLQAQYGLEQQQFGLQGAEALQNRQRSTRNLTEQSAGSGVLNTATQSQGVGDITTQYLDAMKQLGIQRGQAKQAYTYGTEQENQALKQLALTGQEQAAAHTYQQEQIQNALKQLGLQGTEARQQYATGTQQAANTYESLMGQLLQQSGGVYSGEAGQVQNLLNQLFQAGSPSGV